MSIPVIDIFAGPGGLGEGFSSLFNEHGERLFKIALSIEKEDYAHQTLTLRSFYRQFTPDEVPEDYYEVLRGNLTLNELLDLTKYARESEAAKNEAWKAKLGFDEESEDPIEVDRKIESALNGNKNWVLIGGPPCQAYSVVGRSRRREKILDASKDEKVDLYKQYLRILAIHNPSIFVMENVKGLLSAKTLENPLFAKILIDLSDPVQAYISGNGQVVNELVCPGYRIYSLVVEPEDFDDKRRPIFNHNDFVIRCEKYGIPQARHRVILLGVRNDIEPPPQILEKNETVPISNVLSGLPRLRSALSKMEDSDANWKQVLTDTTKRSFYQDIDEQIASQIEKVVGELRLPHKKSGSEFIPYDRVSTKHASFWYLDERIGGVCNHVSRGHMDSDLYRYLFVSCFGNKFKKSPTLSDFPNGLLPNHGNVDEALNEKKFADRFRVQIANQPAKTITSHISKDGHYYIHYDPTQCRSLTVREAARVQTFPDNYYFCGPRTSQFIQVGNAVPPLLAQQIALIVNGIFDKHTVLTEYINA